MTVLDDLNLSTLPVERYGEVRGQLLAEGEELLTRQQGEALTAADAEQFRRLEQAVGALDYRARVAEQDRRVAADPRMAQLLSALDQGGRTDARMSGPGRVGPIVFSDDQVRELYAAAADHRAVSVRMTLDDREAQTRDQTHANVGMTNIITYIVPPVEGAREPTRIASYVPTRPTATPNVTYYQQTALANAADVRIEGAQSPQSDPVWTGQNITAKKVTHWVSVSTESLADYEGFADLVQRELIAGLIDKENQQLLNGTGVDPQMLGLLQTSGIVTYAPGGAEARYRSIRHAKQMLRSGSGFIGPDLCVLNPVDYELFDLSNDATNGLHAVPNLNVASAEAAWNIPIIQSTQIASGTAMVANLAEAATLYVREAPRLFVDPYTLMTSGFVRILAEERLVIGVNRPAAVCRITFNGST